MRTPTELHIDVMLIEYLEQRRERGRKKYGKGLDHNDNYDWLEMAIEEQLDALQYLLAEKLKRGER